MGAWTRGEEEGRLAVAKGELRRTAAAARGAVRNRAEASAAACGHLAALPACREADTVLWYVAMPRELDTAPAIEAALAGGRQRVAVPWCDGDALSLWRLESMAELEPGTWGIPEPPASLRSDPGRRIAPEALDFVVVPGLAFDRRGRRLGHGRGYYDRLLARTRAFRAGLCYEAQVFPDVPAGPRDVPMDWVVTERGTVAVPRRPVSDGSGC